jgi:hypothetical protein
MTLPATIRPARIVDTFDRTAVGSATAKAFCRLEDREPGKGRDAIAVTDETAAEGDRSLKVVDAPGLSREWIPYVRYSLDYSSGTAVASFFLRVDPDARLECVWRGSHPDREFSVGPRFLVDGGRLQVAGFDPLVVPARQWFSVAMTARLGAFDPGIAGAGAETFGVWQLSVTLPGESVRRFENIVIGDDAFADLKAVMFISLATHGTAFHIDSVKIRCD